MIVSKEIQFDKADELVDFLTQKFRTTSLWETNTPGQGGHIFRGQADATWSLTPSVFRTDDALNDFDQQPPGNFSGGNLKTWLSLHVHAELRAVFTFLELADRLGIETPIDYTRNKDHKELFQNIFNESDIDAFKKSFPGDHALHTLEELALGQHHGIPTRLLDWTESPIVGCFFAALKVSSVAKLKNDTSQNIAIFGLDLNKVRDSEKIITVSVARHKNDYLRIQKGVFVHMPFANAYFIENECWPSLEDIVCQSSKLQGALKKYCLPACEADNLLRILYDHEITDYHLMPSLDNIATYYKYDKSLFDIT